MKNLFLSLTLMIGCFGYSQNEIFACINNEIICKNKKGYLLNKKENIGLIIKLYDVVNPFSVHDWNKKQLEERYIETQKIWYDNIQNYWENIDLKPISDKLIISNEKYLKLINEDIIVYKISDIFYNNDEMAVVYLMSMEPKQNTSSQKVLIFKKEKGKWFLSNQLELEYLKEDSSIKRNKKI